MTVTDTLNYTTPVLKKNVPDDNYKVQPLPQPSGQAPYHLNLANILPDAGHQNLVFHMVGDTGSVGSPDFQQLVAKAMAGQYQQAGSTGSQPKFLYHLGDVVYNFGEAEQYYEQFFAPYELYPGPVFAISGNHDADVNPDARTPYQSLDAFTTVFCNPDKQHISFSGPAQRQSNTQPHVYWTLETPLANIIGLYSNVPKYGYITDEQKNWFIEELKKANQARPNKAVIVCIHHAPYSADTNHGSSLYMINFFEDIFRQTNIRPDIIFSGHVHNYQRFEKIYADGKPLPFIVAGAGGYDQLHTIATHDDENYTNSNPLFNEVQLQCYCDNQHGFLKITIEKNAGALTLTGEYYTIPHTLNTNELVPSLADRFVIELS